MSIFKHSADRAPVAIILCFSLLDFVLYFTVESLWVLIPFCLLMIIPKGEICAWNHHHQHCPTFRYKWMNRVLEFFYALHTGVTTNLWVLHHVLGHHHNYLDQVKDESRWKYKNGKMMGEAMYTFMTTVTAYPRGFQVGLKHRRPLKDFLIYSTLTFAIVTALVWAKPLSGLFLFVIPMVLGLTLTAWVTYQHHSGLDETENHFAASHNNVNKWYNIITGNLGYHTAHHYKQGVHWSELPALHEKIKEHIPKELIHNRFFWYKTPIS